MPDINALVAPYYDWETHKLPPMRVSMSAETFTQDYKAEPLGPEMSLVCDYGTLTVAIDDNLRPDTLLLQVEVAKTP